MAREILYPRSPATPVRAASEIRRVGGYIALVGTRPGRCIECGKGFLARRKGVSDQRRQDSTTARAIAACVARHTGVSGMRPAVECAHAVQAGPVLITTGFNGNAPPSLVGRRHGIAAEIQWYQASIGAGHTGQGGRASYGDDAARRERVAAVALAVLAVAKRGRVVLRSVGSIKRGACSGSVR